MNRPLAHLTFALPVLAGLLAVAWVSAGYAGQHPLALTVTLIVGSFFLLGVVELHRYRRATQGLQQALSDDLPAPDSPNALESWLARIPPALQTPVRQRVQGLRGAWPAPALAPYLAALLVLLGMLGTFAGMVVTLRGTGQALQSAGDLAAVRASLAAPVSGLGVAFGTSLAGVATSAMLGLLAALARRERALAGQQLDTLLAGPLRPHTPAHRREAAEREIRALMQRQAEAMPQIADRLHSLASQLQQQQQHFHQQAEAAYTQLASAVGQSLRESLSHSAKAAGDALQPAVQSTLAALSAQAGTLQAGLADQVRQQLHDMAQGLNTHQANVARHWGEALAAQQRSQQELTERLHQSLQAFGSGFQSQSAQLLEQVTAQQQNWLARQTEAHQQHASALHQQLGAAAQHLVSHSAQLLQNAQQTLSDHQTRIAEHSAQQLADWQRALSEHQQTAQTQADSTRQTLTATADALRQHAQTLHDSLASAQASLHAQASQRDAQQLAAWQSALREHQRTTQAQTSGAQQALTAAAAALAAQAGALGSELARTHTQLGTQLVEQLTGQLAAQDTQRLSSWHAALSQMAEQLHQQWQQASAESARQQQAASAQLADTAQRIASQSAAQTQTAVAEVTRLLDAAAVAPRAAAEAMDALRDKLSESLARDTAMLQERERVLASLGTVLEHLQHASGQQRQAIDQLVGTSADMLERLTTRFAERTEAGSARLAQAAAELGASATDIASLGDTFGQAVQSFGDTSAQLGAHLARLDATLTQSIARSDEQLAYYVAQAREVIDLSLSAQQHIVGDLQRLASAPAAPAAASKPAKTARAVKTDTPAPESPAA